MFSSSTFHQHLHQKKEWQPLIPNSPTKPTTTALQLWTEKRNLLGYAQKQIEATKMYTYSHIQRRLKPLPPLTELLNAKKFTHWSRTRIADLAEKIVDKRQWPESAIRAAIALRPKGAPRYAMIKYRLKNSVGKTVRFLLPTDLDLLPASEENPMEVRREANNKVVSIPKVTVNNSSTAAKTTSTTSFNKGVPKTTRLEKPKNKSNNSVAAPTAGASKNKKKKRKSSKRNSNINAASVSAKQNLRTTATQTYATDATFNLSNCVKAETVVPVSTNAHDFNTCLPLLCLAHYGMHQMDCMHKKMLSPEIPILHQLLSENCTTSSTVTPLNNQWTNDRLADLAEAFPNQNLWPKEAIDAALALRPKHINPWSRYKYRLRTSNGKTIRIFLPRLKFNEIVL